MLRDTIIRCVQNLPREPSSVSQAGEFLYQLIEKDSVVTNGQALNIFEYKMGRFQLVYDTNEFPNEAIPRVVEGSVPHHGKPLTWRPTKHNIHMSMAYPGPLSDLGAGQVGNRLRQHDTVGKVVGVNSAMDGVYFDRSYDIEPGLLEA
jgi:hypothetical protein